jgi:hypothetical protein
MKTLVMLVFLVVQGPPSAQLERGVVTGRLLSADGLPASGIRVAAMAVPESGPGISGALLSIAETGKDGRYRLENVPPGRYYVTAGLVDSPTYFPGALTPSGATNLQVLSGKTLEVADFKMLAPAGFKVSGRFVVKPSSGSATVALVSPFTGGMETPVQSDGTFEFTKVLPGTYSLQPYLGLQPLSFVVRDTDITGLELGGGSGVRVSGNIVTSTGSPNSLLPQTIALTGNAQPMVLSVAPPGGFAVGGAGGVLTSVSARTNPDGTFEFLKVAPGNYTIRVPTVPTIGAQPITLVVADKDISGLKVNVPFQAEVPGRVVMEDGSRFQIPNGQPFSIEARFSNGSYGSLIQPDGSFRLRLTEGNYQIGIRYLPLGYALKSVSSGTLDIIQSSLKIAAGEPLNDVVVTVAKVPLDSIKGVRFSGRITGMPPGIASAVRVTLAGSDAGTTNIETTPNPDGTFEFPKVPSGNYSARLTGIPNVSPLGGLQRIFVGTDNVAGFQIPLSFLTPITGKVTVVDEIGRPRTDVVPTGNVQFRRGNGFSGTSLRPDGTFSLSTQDGEVTMEIGGLPPQFTIQSITAGTLDLMKSPLILNSNAPPPEIQVRMVYRP